MYRRNTLSFLRETHECASTSQIIKYFRPNKPFPFLHHRFKTAQLSSWLLLSPGKLNFVEQQAIFSHCSLFSKNDILLLCRPHHWNTLPLHRKFTKTGPMSPLQTSEVERRILQWFLVPFHDKMEDNNIHVINKNTNFITCIVDKEWCSQHTL